MVANATHASHISIDGTFSRCPNTHFQLLTCHAVCWSGYSFPFAFALLPNKRRTTYEKTFNEIDAAAMRTCHRPVFNRADLTILCDFEKGLLKALASLPCTVKGAISLHAGDLEVRCKTRVFESLLVRPRVSLARPVFNGSSRFTATSHSSRFLQTSCSRSK